MRDVEGFHVVEGFTFGRRQKGVDVNIAVDMLMHTVRNNMDRAYLLAGDGYI